MNPNNLVPNPSNAQGLARMQMYQHPNSLQHQQALQQQQRRASMMQMQQAASQQAQQAQQAAAAAAYQQGRSSLGRPPSVQSIPYGAQLRQSPGGHPQGDMAYMMSSQPRMSNPRLSAFQQQQQQQQHQAALNSVFATNPAYGTARLAATADFNPAMANEQNHRAMLNRMNQARPPVHGQPRPQYGRNFGLLRPPGLVSTLQAAIPGERSSLAPRATRGSSPEASIRGDSPVRGALFGQLPPAAYPEADTVREWANEVGEGEGARLDPHVVQQVALAGELLVEYLLHWGTKRALRRSERKRRREEGTEEDPKQRRTALTETVEWSDVADVCADMFGVADPVEPAEPVEPVEAVEPVEPAAEEP